MRKGTCLGVKGKGKEARSERTPDMLVHGYEHAKPGISTSLRQAYLDLQDLLL
jgi:hypothetical protein